MESGANSFSTFSRRAPALRESIWLLSHWRERRNWPGALRRTLPPSLPTSLRVLWWNGCLNKSWRGSRTIDGVINNARIIQPFCRLNDLEYSTIERVLNVNLYGTLFVTKAFLPHLLDRPEAHIANVSSMGGFVPVPGQTMYCAAKAAVKLMSEGLASELRDTQVRVTVVFPGSVATNIRAGSGVSSPNAPAGSGAMRAMPPSKAARIIVNGIERNAYHVFVGTDAAWMDKICRINPAYAARAIANKMRALLPS
jgi:short-subunit dehydrogenase